MLKESLLDLPKNEKANTNIRVVSPFFYWAHICGNEVTALGLRSLNWRRMRILRIQQGLQKSL